MPKISTETLQRFDSILQDAEVAIDNPDNPMVDPAELIGDVRAELADLISGADNEWPTVDTEGVNWVWNGHAGEAAQFELQFTKDDELVGAYPMRPQQVARILAWAISPLVQASPLQAEDAEDAESIIDRHLREAQALITQVWEGKPLPI